MNSLNSVINSPRIPFKMLHSAHRRSNGRQDLKLERHREKRNFITTDTIVRSIGRINQRLENVTEVGNTAKLPTSGSIVQSIVDIHQNFQDVLSISRTMERIFSDVDDLTPKVQVQQAAFDSACKLLFITAAIKKTDVDIMIEDPFHQVWKDAVAHQNLDKVTARFYYVYLITLNHFRETLKQLKAGLKALKRKDRVQDTQKHRFRLKTLKSMSFGTTEDFPDLVQGLKNYNDIFCTLVWQAVPRQSNCILGSSFAEELGHQHNTGTALASQCRLDFIQRATQVLYDTLSNAWTCRTHAVHSLSISLDFDQAKPGATTRSKACQFNVVVTSPYLDSGYRLVINFLHGDYSTFETVQKSRCSKRPYGADECTKAAILTTSSNFSACGAGRQRAGATGHKDSVQNGRLNLSSKEDLCHHLRSSSPLIDLERGTENRVLGYLESLEGFRFLVSSASSHDNQIQSAHSLDEILLRAHNEGRAIPLEDRLRVAWFLAFGVLHLNTSPWLSQAWSAKDVYFFDKDENKGCPLGEPFLQTPLEDNKIRGPVDQRTNTIATRSSLLSFGLVLIELAFSAPWRKLQLREDITENLFTWETDFLNLVYLSETVTGELGSRYAKVVQTCVFQGLEAHEMHGLGKGELDKFISEDIVRELDHCLSVVTFKRYPLHQDTPVHPTRGD